MASDLFGVFQRLKPRESIGVRPDRVVDTSEVGVEFASSFIEEVRQQNGEFVVGEWIFDRPVELVPFFDGLAAFGRGGGEFVPSVTAGATRCANRPGEHVDEEQAASNLPASEVASPSRPPVM